jgi:membrane fusion protein (multidrug efflux system)
MRPVLFLPLITLLVLPSCGKKPPTAAPAMPPAEVTFTPATAETVTITRDLPGRITALRVAEVRARVSGIVLEKAIQEGVDVKAGDLLFKIDPAPLEASKENAAAALARAEATLQSTKTRLARFASLSDSAAISQQDLEDAESAEKVAAAELKAAAAALKSAELDLGYATVTAPISGRAGAAQVTEGALVGEGEATLLAVIRQLDPIHFDFTQSSRDLIALKRAIGRGELSALDPSKAAATILLDDGTEYEHPGKILFSEARVDETTGMVTLRAEFPNADRLLLPGMFARIRVVQAVRENVVTVPQRAVTRLQGGKASVLVIDDTNHARLKVIETDEVSGDKWVVRSGLDAGEKVIIEGHLKAKPGAPVVPEPFTPAVTRSKPVTQAADKS